MQVIILKALLLFILMFLADTSSANSETDFDRALREIGDSGNMVGLAAVIVREGKEPSIHTFGVREFGKPELINKHTTFRIASLSKAFAATIAVDLIEAGELSLGSPIVKFNQHFRLRDSQQTRAATVEDVLTHRLSLPPYAYDNLLEAGVAPPKILQEMKKVTPICAVGTCYAYQNVGFNMIASAIEHVTQRNYADLVQESLFEPLGMTGASMGKDMLMRSNNWARSHRKDRSSFVGENSWKVREVKQAYYNVPAAGGVNASISDMAIWLGAQMGNAPDVVSQQQLKMLHTPLVSTPAELRRNRQMQRLSRTHYGLGWRIYEYAGQTVVLHSGSVEGYTAQIAFLPEQNVGIALLANSRAREFWDILPLFLDYELGLENELLLSVSSQHE